MVFRVGIIKEINVKIIEIIKKMIREIIIREMINVKKSYLKDSLSYSTYA